MRLSEEARKSLKPFTDLPPDDSSCLVLLGLRASSESLRASVELPELVVRLESIDFELARALTLGTSLIPESSSKESSDDSFAGGRWWVSLFRRSSVAKFATDRERKRFLLEPLTVFTFLDSFGNGGWVNSRAAEESRPRDRKMEKVDLDFNLEEKRRPDDLDLLIGFQGWELEWSE